MYSKGEGKGSKHEWIPAAQSIGVLSYVYVKIFKSFAGNNMFSSMTCPSLSSSTILQVPRTHVLFSLASSAPKIASQELKTTDGHPFSLITLDPYSTTIFEAFRQRSNELYIALKALQKGVRSGMATDLELDTTPILGPTADVADGTEEIDSEAEETVESVDPTFS
jgi:hypothetical protein